MNMWIDILLKNYDYPIGGCCDVRKRKYVKENKYFLVCLFIYFDNFSIFGEIFVFL